MPIAPHLKRHYGIEWRTVTRPRILERAGNCCEHCGVPNHRQIARGDAGTWRDTGTGWQPRPPAKGARVRTVYIVLTIAHLNHVSGDDRDENLAALCQWCHLHLDALHHAETRKIRKDLARPLL